MAWLILIVAGILEIGWAVGLKYTDGFSKPLPTVFTILAIILSMGLLGLAARTLPIGTAYAVWTGIGTIGTAVLGMYLFNEPKDAIRIACLLMIVAGILGLKFLTAGK